MVEPVVSKSTAPRADPESAWGSFAAHHAFIVGINAYANGIAPLRTAAHDAKRLAELLGQPTRKDRFHVHAPLIDDGATGAQLRELLGVKNERLGQTLEALERGGQLRHTPAGWQRAD